MSALASKSRIMDSALELCTELANDERVNELQEIVEKFLADDAAKLQYQSVHDRGEALHQKQHAGIELSATEIREFEGARDALFDNQVAVDFMNAQRELEGIQREIGKLVSMTLELGRVPNDEDLAEADGGGCCGSGGGGCGCH
ncbi:MAG: YlbF family regulator [Luteolibacter sp.]